MYREEKIPAQTFEDSSVSKSSERKREATVIATKVRWAE